MPPVAHDLIEPDARIYGDKQCALADAGGLGVLADRRIDRLVPHLHDLRLGATLLEFQRAQHALDDGLGINRPVGVGLFQRADIEAAPIPQHLILWTKAAGSFTITALEGWQRHVAGHR